MNEEQLISLVKQAQAGDRNAFGQLVSHFESTVFAVVMQRLRNHSEASEVTQEVFLRAMRKLSQLREPVRFAGWLRQIAARMAINHAVRRPPETSSDAADYQALDNQPNSPLESLLQNERAEQLRGGLDRLRELDRETLIAFYFEGQSLKQMSVEFRSPIGTIKRRLHTARNRLREALDTLQTV